MSWADIDTKSRDYINDVLDSGWISRRKYIPEFEQSIAAMHGCKYGVMMNSGTDALRIALATLKEVNRWPDNAEVLIPAVTFVATVNIVLQNRLKPRFVDVDRFTYNMNPKLISKAISRNTVAIIPVHLFGLPCQMKEISPIAKKHGLKIIEDSCETMFVHKIQGDFMCFSTYMAHIVQTGVGGVLTTNSAKLDRIARSYMNHGRDQNVLKYRFERVGYSSRPTELEAAIGCAQLDKYQSLLYHRRANAAHYMRRFARRVPVQLPTQAYSQPHSFMFFPMVLMKGNRDRFMKHLRKMGIESRTMMPLINQPPYRAMVKPGQFPVAEWLNKNGVCLPCHPALTEDDVRYVAETVENYFK